MTNPKIRILRRNQIEDTKWDLTIRQAANSLPYAYTWYMDAVCTNWLGFIAGDYEFVMPVPVGRKWGFRYVYQPLFCQQLGIFYRERDETIIDLMLGYVLKKFFYINYNINYDNAGKATCKAISKKKNLVLDLTVKHSDIQKKYSDNALRNVRKGQKAGLIFEEGTKKSCESFCDFYIAHTAIKDPNFKPQHIPALKRLVNQFIIHDCGKLFLAKTSDGEICAGVMIVETNNRIIHLLPAANGYARQTGAMQYLCRLR
jgi:hypothetical protein